MAFKAGSSRWFFAAAVVAWYGLLTMVTLRPAIETVRPPIGCIFCGTYGGVDFALNVALFVPLGVALRLLTGSWRVSIMVGVATTIAVEILQWRTIPGRDASLGDLVANSLGTLIGVGLAIEVPQWVGATPNVARRVSAAFGIATALVVFAVAFLLQPVTPRSSQFVQWMPQRATTLRFLGRLTDVQLNGQPLSPGQQLRPEATIDPATRSLSVRATVGGMVPPSIRLAMIVRVTNNSEEAAYLAQYGDRFLFRSNVVAVRFKLRPVLVGLDGAFSRPSQPSDGSKELILIGHSNPHAMTLARQQGDATLELTMRRTIGMAWTLLWPTDIALTPRLTIANVVWLALLILPVSFLSRRATSVGGVPQHWWPLVLVLACLAAAPAAFGLSSLQPVEWLGVAAGVGAAIQLERLSRSFMSEVSR
jgi:hypothetical protein